MTSLNPRLFLLPSRSTRTRRVFVPKFVVSWIIENPNSIDFQYWAFPRKTFSSAGRGCPSFLGHVTIDIMSSSVHPVWWYLFCVVDAHYILNDEPILWMAHSVGLILLKIMTLIADLYLDKITVEGRGRACGPITDQRHHNVRVDAMKWNLTNANGVI